jgi:acyl transferase domain-containing protein
LVQSCHLIADTPQELHEMAARLGMHRSWYQDRPTASFPHYDLVPSRRVHAVRLGAVEVTGRQLVERMRAIRARLREALVD